MKLQLLVTCAVLGVALGYRRHPRTPSALQCKDENGKNVDWYVVYKIPEEENSLTDGKSYMYITSETVGKGWTMSKQKMGDKTNLMARTIETMYKDSDEELWLVYNDESPIEMDSTRYEGIESSWTTYGHTKGVVGANSAGGFWLVHSIPKFPTLQSYVYPSNALRYGQSALCISLPAEELDKVGNAFKYNVPQFEKSKLSEDLGAKYPTLKEASQGGKAKKAPWQYKFDLTSKAGVKFQVFAKGSSFGKDLYEWLASALGTDMYAETWQNEPHPLPASCSISKKVMNVKSIAYKLADLEFDSHKDHSKWAISASSSKPFVCIGDINRALPQEKRGGGTICINNEGLWKSYNGIIEDKDSCDSFYHYRLDE